MKILANDKITAFRNLQKAHEALKDPNLTIEQRKELAEIAVRNDEENVLIELELTHFAEAGEILGKHVIFSTRKIKSKLDKLTVLELAKRLNLVESYIRRDRANAAKAETEADKEKFEQKVKKWELEKTLIKKAL